MTLFSDYPTLLVVETPSHRENRIRVAARRAMPGLDVRVAGDAREGVAYLAGAPPFQDRCAHPFPDLVIIDPDMPEGDGLSVLEGLEDTRAIRPVTAVVLTAAAGSEDEERAGFFGADAYYRKPSELAELTQTVTQIVGTWLFEGTVQRHNARGRSRATLSARTRADPATAVGYP